MTSQRQVGFFFLLFVMANTKSAIKNVRKTVRQTERNKRIKSRLKTLARKYKEIDAATAPEDKKAAAIQYVSALDKAAKSKIIHSNFAERRKSLCSSHIFAKSGS